MSSISIVKETAIQNYLLYVWSISTAKNRHYPKYFILCVIYSIAKDRHFTEECSLRLWS